MREAAPDVVVCSYALLVHKGAHIMLAQQRTNDD
jgi:hypothetical protein